MADIPKFIAIDPPEIVQAVNELIDDINESIGVSGGNVSNTGTPTAGQIAVWSDSTTIAGSNALSVNSLNSGIGATENTFWRGDGTWGQPMGVPIVRSQIPTMSLLPSTFIVAGLTTTGDLGAGAIYSNQAAGPSSPMAIQSAAGIWYGLVVNGAANPGWFGAKGDGITDDTVAIQAAINTGSCQLEDYTYLVGGTNAALSIPSGGSLIGRGATSVLRFRLSSHLATVNGILINGVSNVYLANFQINGLRLTDTSTGNNGIFVEWRNVAGSNVAIDNVSVDGFAGNGILALATSGTASSGFTITNCRATNMGAGGLGSQDYISNVLMQGNFISNTGLGVADRGAITTSRNGTGVVVANNICVGSPSALGTSCHGISVDTSTDVICTGNTCIGWIAGFGIEVGFVTNGVFSGNMIAGSKRGIGLSAIQGLFFNTNIAVCGNTIYGCVYGIYSFVTAGTGTQFHTNVSVTGNTISASTEYGVLLNLVNGLTISGNTITSCVKSGMIITDCIGKYIGSNVIRQNNITTLKTVTSITRSSGTATVVCTGHGLTTGDFMNMFGASPADFNILGQVTVSDANTFTYPVNAGMVGTTAAGSMIQCTKTPSLSEAGVVITQSLLSNAKETLFGENLIEMNGNKQISDIGYSGGYGFFNDWFVLRGAPANLRVENMTSGVPANALDRIAIGIKSGKLVIAHNQGGTAQFLTMPLDGTTTTFTNSTTPP